MHKSCIVDFWFFLVDFHLLDRKSHVFHVFLSMIIHQSDVETKCQQGPPMKNKTLKIHYCSRHYLLITKY